MTVLNDLDHTCGISDEELIWNILMVGLSMSNDDKVILPEVIVYAEPNGRE